MTERVVVRAATAQDFAALVRCDSYAEKHASRREMLQDAVAARHCVAAFADQKPVGYVIVNDDFFGHAFVPVLVVDAAYRRRGIGSRLLATVESATRGKKLFISANTSNRAAQNLFVRAGFERSGRVENLDEDDAELIFVKQLPHQAFTLRQATSADIDAMHGVRMSVFENRLTRGRVSRDDYVEHLDVAGRGWVVDVGGRIVALGICNAQTGNIWGLFVLPDFQRRGFGQRLLDKMVDWLWQQGLDRIWLTTESNTRARDISTKRRVGQMPASPSTVKFDSSCSARPRRRLERHTDERVDVGVRVVCLSLSYSFATRK